MECNGTMVNNNEQCHEKCSCRPETVPVGNKSYSVLKRRHHRKPKFALAHFSEGELKALQKMLSKWIKVPKGAESKHNPLNDKRAKFVEKMLKNYEHLRKREKELQTLQTQQKELKGQQESLENMLKSQEYHLKGEMEPSGGHKTNENNRNKDIVASTKSAEVTGDLSRIRKQLAQLEMHEELLTKEQALMFVQLQQEKHKFAQVRKFANGMELQTQSKDRNHDTSAFTPQFQGVFSKMVENGNPNANLVKPIVFLNQEDSEEYNSPLSSDDGEDQYRNIVYKQTGMNSDDIWSDDGADRPDEEFVTVEKKTLHPRPGKGASKHKLNEHETYSQDYRQSKP